MQADMVLEKELGLQAAGRDRQTDRQMDRRTDGQVDRHTGPGLALKPSKPMNSDKLPPTRPHLLTVSLPGPNTFQAPQREDGSPRCFVVRV